ncbi:MAG: hypothetical protein WCJ26_13665 [bacterium]
MQITDEEIAKFTTYMIGWTLEENGIRLKKGMAVGMFIAILADLRNHDALNVGVKAFDDDFINSKGEIIPSGK